jgi:hypothetical protein
VGIPVEAGWLKPNHLKGNDEKTVFLIIAPHRRLAKLEPLPKIQIGSTSVSESTHVRNLGAQFDSKMSMYQNVSRECTIKSVDSKVRRYLDRLSCARVINALVTSRLDFQNGLLLGLPDCEVHRLQKAQNAAARLLTQTKRRDHITPILEELHWLPVSSRIQYKVLLIAHKILYHEDSPRYLKELLSLRVPSRGLRSSDDPWLLAIPRSKGTYGDRSLGVMAPKLCNSQPLPMRGLEHTNLFKKQLKTELFRRHFG